MPAFRFSPSNVRDRREALGIRREELALRVDRSAETIASYERGTAAPPAHLVAVLATALECDPGDFYESLEAAA